MAALARATAAERPGKGGSLSGERWDDLVKELGIKREHVDSQRRSGWSGWVAFALFIAASIIVGSTVAGPGISWDEPAYRHSQVTLQNWFRLIGESSSVDQAAQLFSKDAIHRFWEYNRFGHNFHPPLGGLLNLLSWSIAGTWWDDLSARRLSSALEFAGCVAILGHFLGRRYGRGAGLFAASTLLFMPRIVGDAHVVGTDMPMLLFWVCVALAFWKGLDSRRWQWMTGVCAGALFDVKFSGVVVALPCAVWLAIEWIIRTSPSERRRLFEFPWVVLLVAPLTAIALNPTWWHDTAHGLREYLELNVGRRGKLPDIGIFYLGKRYIYTLPWHSALVLTLVTVPFGSLLLGLIGSGQSLLVARRDRLPAYFLVQALALPFFRMLGTPAHDGVRLFLPTFFFLAGLAGLAASSIASSFSDARRRRIAWTLLIALGPLWSAGEWIGSHPYELSYYNVGLRRAVDWGFETTYWYDAVTPRVLRQINEKLPAGATVLFPDALINPEVFWQAQELGRLRSDIGLENRSSDSFRWFWLLTHSSKSTAFTRILYGLPPWYSSSWQGVRMFSVIDPHSAAIAWALHALVVEQDQTNKLGPLVLNQATMSASADDLARAIAWIKSNKGVPSDLDREPRAIQALVDSWMAGGELKPSLRLVLDRDPSALDDALFILQRRRADLRMLLEAPGYPLPDRFGGLFEPPPTMGNP